MRLNNNDKADDALGKEYARNIHESLQVGFLKVFAFAAVLTAANYIIIFLTQYYFYSGTTTPYLLAVYIERGTLPYIITFVFWAGIVFLYLKWQMLRVETDAINSLDIPGMYSDAPLDPQLIETIKESLDNLPTDRKNRLITRRIDTTMTRLRQGRASELHETFTQMSDLDYNISDTSYLMLRYFIIILPVLGFIGTVLGISTALGSFGVLISPVNELGETSQPSVDYILSNIGGVTGNLGIAFDTTLLALALSAVLTGFSYIIQQKNENLLTILDDFCVNSILNRLSIPTENNRYDLICNIEAKQKENIETIQEQFKTLFSEITVLLAKGNIIDVITNLENGIANFERTLNRNLDASNDLRQHMIAQNEQQKQTMITLDRMIETLDHNETTMQQLGEITRKLQTYGIPITIGNTIVSHHTPVGEKNPERQTDDET